MKSLLPKKKSKRDKPLTVRLPEETMTQLNRLSQKLGVTKTNLIEHWIKTAYEELKRKKS
jgi:predicted DNA-binding protein